MNELDCVYLAAFLDTDGWITIVPRNKGTTHGVQMAIVNRHLGVLQWAQSVFGGSINPRKINRISPHAKNWSQTYDLNFRSAEQVSILNAVLPYLKIKRKQAELALELLATKQDRTKEYRLTPEVRQRRLEIYLKARGLNWSGVDRSGLESFNQRLGVEPS